MTTPSEPEQAIQQWRQQAPEGRVRRVVVEWVADVVYCFLHEGDAKTRHEDKGGWQSAGGTAAEAVQRAIAGWRD